MKESIIKGIKSILIFVIVVAVIVGLLITFFSFIPIKGSSMLPTIEDADNVLILKHVEIKKGDIVVFEDEDGTRLIKRVIALEGEEVELKDNGSGTMCFYVNGELLDEPYVNQNAITSTQHVAHKATVPEGCFYYLGDNRIVSKDSSSLDASDVPVFGETSAVLGKVIFRYNVVNKWEFEKV